MGKMVVRIVLLLSLAVFGFWLLGKYMPSKKTPLLPADLESKALRVTRQYLAGEYEMVYAQLSESSRTRYGRKALAIRATKVYRSNGKWVRHLKPTDVHSVRMIHYSPDAKAFLVYFMSIDDYIPDIRRYLVNRSQSEIPMETLDRYMILEVLVGNSSFQQIWRRDSDGEWRLLSWSLDGDPETTAGWLRIIRREGINP